MAKRPLVIFGDGSQTRDFSFVADTARGILLAGTREEALGHTINLGTGTEIRIDELARAVGDVLGGDVTVQHEVSRPGDVLRLCADATKAAELLGFRTEVPLRRGLELLRDWYRASGARPEVLLEREVVKNWEAPHA
jgi:UDP-glucose 4-epimerase